MQPHQALHKPGSPAIRMAEPGTTPPPQTRSNSSTPVTMRGGAGVSTSRVSKARPGPRLDARGGASAPGGAAPASSSTRVFHCPQALHCPAHLEWTAPQAWQA
jgi:hypothetical protein